MVYLQLKVLIIWPWGRNHKCKQAAPQSIAQCDVGSLVEVQISNVEKNFLWRACHKILPTKASLCRRKVTTNALCPICGLEEDTWFHILWDYPSTRDVWSGSLKKFHKISLCGPTFGRGVEEMFKTCNEEELRLYSPECAATTGKRCSSWFFCSKCSKDGNQLWFRRT